MTTTTNTKSTRVRRGSSKNTQVRISLDPNSLARVEQVRDFVEADTGQRLSLSMTIRLALHLTATRIKAVGAKGGLAGQVKANAEGR